jgi:transcription elongation factor GreA
MSEEVLLTQEGYDKIVAEHEELVAVRRAEVAERIKEAISYGDISENAEYDSAKNEQAELENRILKLEAMLRNARIIKDEELTGERVVVGLTVSIKDLEDGEVSKYSIVGPTEADPFEGRLSTQSEVGKALLGHETGDIVEVHTLSGSIRYEILSIEK